MELDLFKTKLLIIDKCWNIKDLSQNAHVSYHTVSQNISGRTKASFATIGKIAKALNVAPKEIIKNQ